MTETITPARDIADTQPSQVHFSEAEFTQRRRRVQAAMQAQEIDCLIVSRLEDQYWLAGFDSSSASVFHLMFLTVEGELLHLSRSADLGNLAYTSQCRDVRVFNERFGASKGAAVKDVLTSLGMSGRRVGLETDSVGMSLALHQELVATFDGWCDIADTSQLIRSLRRVKSQEELAYMRRAGEILHEASTAAVQRVRPGAFEGEVMGEFQRRVAESDAESYTGWPLGSGDRALLVRPVSGRGHIGECDQVMFEPGVSYRHYWATSMFTVLTGPRVDERHLAMHAACVEALDSVQQVIRPGRTFGELYEEHRSVLARHGQADAALQACGYSLGAVWETTWMEPPMMAAHVPLELEEHMTIFTHMILLDRVTGLAMALGETVEVTDGEPRRISRVPRTPMIVDA